MSKLQEAIDLSTTKVEYIVVLHVCKKEICLRGILGDIRRTHKNGNVLCDTQSVIHLDTNLACHSDSKYLNIKYHFVRQVIDGGGVDLKRVHTQERSRNMFTKPVLLEKIHWCLNSLSL